MHNQPNRRYWARLARAGQALGADGSPADLLIEVEALRRAVDQGKFEACAVFVDHAPARENPSLDRLVGVTSQAAFDGENANGMITLLNRPEAQEIAALLDEIIALGGPAAQGGSAPDVGLSIVFWPKFAPRLSPNKPRRVVEIRKVESVDFVFQPAADGRVLRDLTGLHMTPIDQNLDLTGLHKTIPDHVHAMPFYSTDHSDIKTCQVLYKPIFLSHGGTLMNEDTSTTN